MTESSKQAVDGGLAGGGATPRRIEIFNQILRLWRPGRLVDLGAGHGIFAQAAAAAGWTVTAVDARPDRFPDDPSIRWITQDVRQTDLTGYDLIACLGLFYHLTPDDQISLLRRAQGTPIIVDTHVDNGLSTHPLSERERVGDYEGSWYREPGKLTSSWGNKRSFWPTPESLSAMFAACGYPVVLAAQPWIKPDRTFFLALPSGYATPVANAPAMSALRRWLSETIVRPLRHRTRRR